MTTKVTKLRVQAKEKRVTSSVRSFCPIDPLEARNRQHAIQTTPFLPYSFTTVVNDVSHVFLRVVDANVFSSPLLSSPRHRTLFPLRSNIARFKLFNFLLLALTDFPARSPRSRVLLSSPCNAR